MRFIISLSVFLLIDLVGASQVAPKVLWHKSYNGTGEESHPHYVIQTKDLGFLMVGRDGIRGRSFRQNIPG